MKQDDFERLKAICEKEGFTLETQFVGGGNCYITRKDPWEGVEFVECVDAPIGLKGKIFKGYVKNNILFYCIDGEFKKTGFKEAFKPSTETAYVDQLKKEAFVRFGGIKEGDRFDFTNTGYPDQNDISVDISGKEWTYYRDTDRLLYYGWGIYQQGKWAERVKERVKVPDDVLRSISRWINTGISFKAYSKIEGDGIEDKTKTLASFLEKYLNGEIE